MSTNNPTDNNTGKPDSMSQEEWDVLPVIGKDGKKGKKDYFETNETELRKLQQKIAIDKEYTKAKSEAELDKIKHQIAIDIARRERALVNKAENDRKAEKRQAIVKAITTPINKRAKVLTSGIEDLTKVSALFGVIVSIPTLIGTLGGSAFFGVGAIIGVPVGAVASILVATITVPFVLASMVSTAIGTFWGLITGKTPSSFKRFSATIKNGISSISSNVAKAISKEIDPKNEMKMLHKLADAIQPSEPKANEKIAVATAAATVGLGLAAKEKTTPSAERENTPQEKIEMVEPPKKEVPREQVFSDIGDSVTPTSVPLTSATPEIAEQVTQRERGLKAPTSGEMLRATQTTARSLKKVTDSSLVRGVVGVAGTAVGVTIGNPLLGRQAVQGLKAAGEMANKAENMAGQSQDSINRLEKITQGNSKQQVGSGKPMLHAAKMHAAKIAAREVQKSLTEVADKDKPHSPPHMKS